MQKNKKVDEYILSFSEETQVILNKIRNLVADLAPDAEEAMTYGIPTFKLNGNLVHFAAFKEHIGFYPTPSGIIKFKEELKKYETTKGAIRFSLGEKIPFDLIKKIVIFRIEENNSKS